MTIRIYISKNMHVNRGAALSKSFIYLEGVFGMSAFVSDRDDVNQFFWNKARVTGTRAIIKIYCVNDDYKVKSNPYELLTLDGEVDFAKEREELTVDVQGAVSEVLWERLANDIHTNEHGNMVLTIPRVDAGVFNEDEFEIRAKVQFYLETFGWEYEVTDKPLNY